MQKQNPLPFQLRHHMSDNFTGKMPGTYLLTKQVCLSVILWSQQVMWQVAERIRLGVEGLKMMTEGYLIYPHHCSPQNWNSPPVTDKPNTHFITWIDQKTILWIKCLSCTYIIFGVHVRLLFLRDKLLTIQNAPTRQWLGRKKKIFFYRYNTDKSLFITDFPPLPNRKAPGKTFVHAPVAHQWHIESLLP